MFKVSNVVAYLLLQLGQLIKTPLECDVVNNELVKAWLNI
jgi:hypothetical protein